MICSALAENVKHFKTNLLAAGLLFPDLLKISVFCICQQSCEASAFPCGQCAVLNTRAQSLRLPAASPQTPRHRRHQLESQTLFPGLRGNTSEQLGGKPEENISIGTDFSPKSFGCCFSKAYFSEIYLFYGNINFVFRN